MFERIAEFYGLMLSREEEAANKAKLEGARLVGRTVADEINNALAPIVGYGELISQRPSVEGDPKAVEYAHLISVAAEDAAAKVARLQRIVRLEEKPTALGPDLSTLDMERSTQV
jgi:hypothetical protein